MDAVNVTDNPGASVMPASMAGSVLAQRAGLEPVMQLTCRDRNRIALQSDLLGAGLLGIPNVLLLTGDHQRFGDHPGAKPVFDLDSVTLVGAARALRDSGRLLGGRTVSPPPSWLIGAVENPFAAPQRFRAARLAKKIAAGAEFVQTQFVFDVPMFARFMADVRDLGLTDQCTVLAGIGPIRSPRALEFMRSEVPGIHVPDDVVRRLTWVPSDGSRPRACGCAPRSPRRSGRSRASAACTSWSSARRAWCRRSWRPPASGPGWSAAGSVVGPVVGPARGIHRNVG